MRPGKPRRFPGLCTPNVTAAQTQQPPRAQVLGTVKNAALVIFCVIFLAERVTPVQGAGYTVALLGFSWYQYIKTVAPHKGGAAVNGAERDAKAALSRLAADGKIGGGGKGGANGKAGAAAELDALITVRRNSSRGALPL